MDNIKIYIKTMNYPCLKEELVGMAEERGASSNVLGRLENLPAEFFSDQNEVLEFLK